MVQWTRLNLEGNDLGKDGANPIFWALRVNCTLTELLMSDNKIGGDFGTDRDKMGEHGNSLAGAIEYITRCGGWTWRGMIYQGSARRGHALLENPCLVAFNFERNSFDAGAADQLATRLATDGQIKFLNLRCNHVSGRARRAAAALETNIGLHLDLGYNGAGSCGPVAAGPRRRSRRTESKADLEGNELGPVGLAARGGHRVNNTLRYLNVRNNRFDARTARSGSRVTADLGLMEICFSVCRIGGDNFQKVA